MIRYESVRLTSRIDLLTKIESFLGVCGWETHRKSDEILYASDSFDNGGLIFKFMPHKVDHNENSSIYVCNTINKDETIYHQDGLKRVAHFQFQKQTPELDRVHLIGDDKNFTLYIDCDNAPLRFNLFFTAGWLNKTHEFSGGRVIYSSCYDLYSDASTINFYDVYYQPYQYPAFSQETQTFMSLGGVWEGMRVMNLRTTRILTNLINQSSDNQLSALSAMPLLNVGKSALSGLYTMITPNFFYLNNQNVFVHAGDFDFVRVLNTKNEVKNGQILHLGDEKFIALRPHATYTNITNLYILAVKIA